MPYLFILFLTAFFGSVPLGAQLKLSLDSDEIQEDEQAIHVEPRMGPNGGSWGCAKEETPIYLNGIFYDFNLDADGNPAAISDEQCLALLNQFVNNGWDRKVFDRYFNLKSGIRSSLFYFLLSPVDAFLEKYGITHWGDKGRWCIIYSGMIKAPKSGSFRFVGGAVDNMSIRFNNKTVFDYGIRVLSLGVPVDALFQEVWTGIRRDAALEKKIGDSGIGDCPSPFYEYSETGGWKWGGMESLAAGKVFQVQKGEDYPIEIMVSNVDGRLFSMILLLEEIGAVPAKKDDETKMPYLPLFRTSYAIPSSKGKGIGPFDPVGVVWRIIKT